MLTTKTKPKYELLPGLVILVPLSQVKRAHCYKKEASYSLNLCKILKDICHAFIVKNYVRGCKFFPKFLK